MQLTLLCCCSATAAPVQLAVLVAYFGTFGGVAWLPLRACVAAHVTVVLR